MAALDFPDTPTLGQVYERWTWNGTVWALTVSIATLVNKEAAALGTDSATSWDSFNRAALGTLTDSGHTWTIVSGAWSIIGNILQKTGTVSEALLTTIGVGDGLVACDVLEVNSRLAFRIVDNSNFLAVRLSATGAVELLKREVAVTTVIASTLPNPALVGTFMNRLEVSLTGDKITVAVNGGPVLYWTLTAAESTLFPNTLTTCGISAGSTVVTGRWDNFYTSKLPKHTTITPPPSIVNKTSAVTSMESSFSWDSFSRTNGALGTSDSGHPWTLVSSTWTVESGQARKTGTQTDALATIPGVGDGLVGCDVLDSNSRLCFRVIDAANYLTVRLITTTGVVELAKREAAAQTVLAASMASPNLVTTVLMQRLEVSFTGAEITVSVSGVPVLRHTLSATDLTLFPATLTTCGISMLASTTASRWDNFLVSRLPKHGHNAMLGAVPVGTIVDYIATATPANWLAMTGQTIVNGQFLYPLLYPVLPTIYKPTPPDIVMPDTRGKVAVGYTTTDALFNAIGDAGGSKDAVVVSHTHPVDPPSHTHAVDPPNTAALFGAAISSSAGYYITPAGGGPIAMCDVGLTNAQVDIASFTSGAYDFASFNTGAASSAVAGTNMNLQPYITFNKIIRAS